MSKIILASGSAIRARILRGAGVEFEVIRPEIDEDAIKRIAVAEKLDLEAMAMRLAEAKTMAVAKRHGGIVIGSDQILEFHGRPFDKPATMAEARARLIELQGHRHSLINAAALARDGKIIWRHLERPRLTMRAMSEIEIDAYLGAAGDDILSSVGAYQVERLGARLFERIEGDYFAVLGLSLFALLDVLRRHGAIAF